MGVGTHEPGLKFAVRTELGVRGPGPIENGDSASVIAAATVPPYRATEQRGGYRVARLRMENDGGSVKEFITRG
ncbi:hypothetical protein [Natrinema altunense]|uniref:Uncharacterized protein n=1 Tax=Natrinema altunense TaxID=222984 RepID=A0A482Y630_9EURY|nr:hypothetical protein [Natrinema altunense]RZH69605.1 hypothetical protein ELS17_09425 [Natrinema altunense]